ncbi:N-acetylmuramoyl-L-alanine amidase [Taibaiella sp. KBW10]|uniref:N-acetylmuramoyl-L-alanine amidase family protein n=1 Tax=Taibaiella sp. KBW10 TaxID=2153357 RepID=UPI000F5B014D|nr:N-acetylmuramoyl-L-alanine amidase [Taibaiella sp. KBW10]RQO30797.1 N-acetylmuramoyl-L-alanine amidase [Taibaiella sp. KBW10]
MDKMKSIAALFLIFTLGISNFLFAQKIVAKVVLDAGHGGKDPGAIGTFSKEKDIALAITLKVRDILNREVPQLKTILTRDNDFFVELKQRHEIANKANADLFVSIHVNATAGTRTRVSAGTKKVKKGRKYVQVPVYKTIVNRATSVAGTETYVLGLTRNSQKEKAIGEYSETVADEPGLLDESDPTTAIIIAQYSQAFLGRSVTLGSKVQQNFAKAGRGNFGVKQKSLEVLAGSVMPGVLIEVGFINNTDEEAYLNSAAGQMALAQSIADAIKDYKLEVEKKK